MSDTTKAVEEAVADNVTVDDEAATAATSDEASAGETTGVSTGSASTTKGKKTANRTAKAAKKVVDTAAETTSSTAMHTKEKFLRSKAFAGDYDLINALLEDGKSYSKDEVRQMIDEYKKGTVE